MHGSDIVLSKREVPHPFVGWVAVDEFEDLFSSLTGSRIVSAKTRPPAGLFGKFKNRLTGPYLPVADVGGDDLLRVIARAPNDLGMLLSTTYFLPRRRGRTRSAHAWACPALCYPKGSTV